MSNSIVLIHGLWMTPRSWEQFAERYSAAGHDVHAPSWPGLEGDVEALRDDPSPLASLSITRIVDHYERFIRSLDTAPIIMGHSFGGLFMQLLIERGLGAAGVGLSGAQPRGIRRLPLSTLRSGGRILRNPLNRHRAVEYTLEDFHYTMTNTLTLEASTPYYERYAVPAAGRVLFEGAMAELNPKTPARVDFARPGRAPMLLVGAGQDHVVPAAVTRSLVKRYRGSASVTDYVEYEDRPHFPGVPGWEEVADHVLEWSVGQLSPTP